jgi:hypothetical protein
MSMGWRAWRSWWPWQVIHRQAPADELLRALYMAELGRRGLASGGVPAGGYEAFKLACEAQVTK